MKFTENIYIFFDAKIVHDRICYSMCNVNIWIPTSELNITTTPVI